MNTPHALENRIAAAASPFGSYLRTWRLRRRLSQEELAGVHASLLQPPSNVLRVSLDPLGLATSIVNLTQWREHLFERLSHQIAATADHTLISLLEELRRLPAQKNESEEHIQSEHMGIAGPLKLRTAVGVLSFFSTTTVFGSPADVTLQELALETFFPLDEFTKQALQAFPA